LKVAYEVHINMPPAGLPLTVAAQEFSSEIFQGQPQMLCIASITCANRVDSGTISTMRSQNVSPLQCTAKAVRQSHVK
jgi:hypothetical protein